MKREVDWNVEGRDWPNRSSSRFVVAGGLRWHVQVSGTGPVLLLIHGTGAATHSWRGLLPALSRDFTVVAPDLPGHGFSTRSVNSRLSLPKMAAGIGALIAALGLRPQAVVGHSAGAAIALRMVLDGTIAPRHVVSVNGALAPFPGQAGIVFPALAKLLFLNPLAAPILAWRADDRAAVARVIEGTGSRIDPEGLDQYRRLLRTRRHIESTLGMMANWDLWPLLRELPRLQTPLTLLAATGDKAVPMKVAKDVNRLVMHSTMIAIPECGHLAHEERPAVFLELIRNACV